MTRATRWIVAAILGLAMTAVDCARAPSRERPQADVSAETIVDDSVVHAFDTRMETRLLDRFELDHFLRDRDIRVRVVDGTVNLTGQVWTPLEKERATELVRRIPGVIDVANDLEIQPPG